MVKLNDLAVHCGYFDLGDMLIRSTLEGSIPGICTECGTVARFDTFDGSCHCSMCDTGIIKSFWLLAYRDINLPPVIWALGKHPVRTIRLAPGSYITFGEIALKILKQHYYS